MSVGNFSKSSQNIKFIQTSVANLDVVRPAILLPLPFDPSLDQLQCFFPGGTRTLDLHCCIVSALVQRGTEALRQGVAPRTGLRAELALCAVFGICGKREYSDEEREEIQIVKYRRRIQVKNSG